ncbi:MAG TPA: THUMP domain-containing protein [Candidatus Thermoplasmatota archaeon]|nr:THUMP domain-containing protein [Candidatus Thermoplasmatota archaeon]
MAWPPILVRYGEIGIKSPQVRAQFERKLVARIEEQLVKRGVEAEVRREWGRMMLRASDVEGALDALRHTFGVVSASPAVECAATPEAVAAEVLEVARSRLAHGQSFAVRVKRSGTHPFTSLDVAKACAERILTDLKDRAPRVDLDEPDVEARVEVREGRAFVFTRTERGPGGLPLGSQGRVAVLVDAPRAAHAAWLMGKRGAALYFFAHDEAAAAAWLRPLEPWVSEVRLRPLRASTRGEMLQELAPHMAEHRCHALVVADGLDAQLASRDLDALAGVPVFRPLVGYPGNLFRDLARKAELPEDA